MLKELDMTAKELLKQKWLTDNHLIKIFIKGLVTYFKNHYF